MMEHLLTAGRLILRSTPQARTQLEAQAAADRARQKAAKQVPVPSPVSPSTIVPSPLCPHQIFDCFALYIVTKLCRGSPQPKHSLVRPHDLRHAGACSTLQWSCAWHEMTETVL